MGLTLAARERCEVRPSRRLRAITRAAALRTWARKAAVAFAPCEAAAGWIWFQLPEPVMRIRSVPAVDRPLGGLGDAGAGQHRLRLDAVGHDRALEAEVAAEEVREDGPGLRGDVLLVERRCRGRASS